jgi:pimeloyl-ACP methyl ester carboxylesterase
MQSLERCSDAVLQVVRAQPEPVILVGHSFGGMTISAVAEAAPERIRRLVYLAAYLPRTGESLQTLSAEDHDNKFTQENFVVAPDYSTAHVLARDTALIFANDARSARQAAIAGSLQPEPLAPMAMPVSLTAERFGRVSRAYVFTLRDNAISLPMQRRMVERTPVAESFEINAGHAPFATQPRRLVRILLQIADQ